MRDRIRAGLDGHDYELVVRERLPGDARQRERVLLVDPKIEQFREPTQLRKPAEAYVGGVGGVALLLRTDEYDLAAGAEIVEILRDDRDALGLTDMLDHMRQQK